MKNWYEAQQSCQQEGGDLAMAKTVNTNVSITACVPSLIQPQAIFVLA